MEDLLVLVLVAIVGVALGVFSLSPPATAAVRDTTAIGAGEVKVVELLASATATNGPPSAASDGLALQALSPFGALPNEAVLAIGSTAGSGTMTARRSPAGSW